MESGKAIRKFQKELNAGAISIVLLGLLKQQRKAMYGYQIAKHLESRTDGSLPMNQGALYPVLRSLEKQGLLSSDVEPSVAGPPRRYYSITKGGKQALSEWTRAWQSTKQFVDAALEDQDEHNTKRASAKVSGSPRAGA